MLENPTVGDLIEHMHTYKIAKVVEVNRSFSWFKVQYLDDSFVREHVLYGNKNQSFRRLTSQEKADLVLKLERAGITDFWREE